MGKTRKFIALVLSGLLFLSMSSSAVFAATSQTPQGTPLLPAEDSTYAADEILVVYKDTASKTNIKRYIKNTKACDTETTTLQDGQSFSVLTMENGQTVEEALTACADSPIVDYVQPNYIYHRKTKTSSSEIVSDADRFWHFDSINLDGATYRYKAFAKEKTPANVLVAVLDSGVDLEHEDLQTHISRDLSKKVTKEGKIEPLTGDSDIFDGHGTHVCGIIGATADNTFGAKGVAASVLGNHLSIAAIDIFNFYDDKKDDGDGDGINDYDEFAADTASIVKGLDYARKIGADVINLSLGSYGEDKAEKAAIKRCTDAGITVVAAAGNESTAQENYPADYPHVLSVIASGKEASSSDWSNYGKEKDITAPGEAIYSTLPTKLTKYSAATGANKGKEYDTEKYDFMDGTSMAAPIVSSVAAILYALGPSSTLTRIENAICKTAKDIGPKGKDTFTGNGLIDAGKAVQFIIAPITPTGYRAQLATNKKTTASNYRTVQLSWNKMFRATGYRIAYKAVDAETYTYQDVPASVNGLTLKLSAGTKYKFKVRGYRDIGKVRNYSPYTAIKVLTTLKAPMLNKITKTSNDDYKLKWSNIDGESGYQIYKRKGKNGKWFTVKWKKAGYSTFTDEKINKKYTYYYRVRAYKNVTVNGVTKKVYGPWSKVRSR